MNNKQRKQIKNAFDRLSYTTANRSWSNPTQDLFKLELKSEKQHRRGDEARFNCTPTEAAKYFTVKHVFDGLTQKNAVANMLHIRLECYYGEAIAEDFNAEILKEFSQDEIDSFLKLDYVELIS